MKRSIKRWNLKKIFVIAGVAAIVAGLAGCGGTKKDADKTTEINVGYFNNVTHAQALYMKAQGTLDKAFDGKAKVKWTFFLVFFIIFSCIHDFIIYFSKYF